MPGWSLRVAAVLDLAEPRDRMLRVSVPCGADVAPDLAALLLHEAS